MNRRKQGEGTLRLRKDGRWEGRIVIGYDENNMPKTKTVTAKTKFECEEKIRKLKEELGKAREKIKPDMPFGEWLDFWYQNFCKPALRETTKASYENFIYNHIIPTIGKIPLNKLLQNDLQQFYARLKKGGRLKDVNTKGTGVSDRMVRSCHGRCRSALEKAVTEGLIATNPAIGCKLPPKKGREMQVLTPNEIARFLARAKEEGYYEIFLLELSTGMRRGEILALKWSDVNFKDGSLRIQRQAVAAGKQIIVQTPKTRASIRTILLPSYMIEILAKLKQSKTCEWVFPSPVKEGEPRNPTALHHRFKLILKRASCKDIRFHDLRHTFATMALENGMDVKTLSGIIGHISAETTVNTKYGHTKEKNQIREIKVTLIQCTK